jgi:sporulation protein YlmC with PRC-barrel domain
MTRERATTAPKRGEKPVRVLLAELVGRNVQTAARRTVGQVIDIELELERGQLQVVGLELGRHGIFDRLHLLRPLVQRFAGAADPVIVPWSDVERLEGDRIVIRGEGPRRRGR